MHVIISFHELYQAHQFQLPKSIFRNSVPVVILKTNVWGTQTSLNTPPLENKGYFFAFTLRVISCWILTRENKRYLFQVHVVVVLLV